MYVIIIIKIGLILGGWILCLFSWFVLRIGSRFEVNTQTCDQCLQFGYSSSVQKSRHAVTVILRGWFVCFTLKKNLKGGSTVSTVLSYYYNQDSPPPFFFSFLLVCNGLRASYFDWCSCISPCNFSWVCSFPSPVCSCLMTVWKGRVWVDLDVRASRHSLQSWHQRPPWSPLHRSLIGGWKKDGLGRKRIYSA